MLGLQSFPGLFLPLIFLLIFSTVIYGLSQLQQTDLVQAPVFTTYGRYLELTEKSFKITPPSALSTSVNLWRASIVYLGIYQEFPSLPVLCQPT